MNPTSAAPKHIPHAIRRTTSIVLNIAKLGLVAVFQKAADPRKAMNRQQQTGTAAGDVSP